MSFSQTHIIEYLYYLERERLIAIGDPFVRKLGRKHKKENFGEMGEDCVIRLETLPLQSH